MEGVWKKCSRVTKRKEARKGGIKDGLAGRSGCEGRAFISSSLLRLLLFLLLAVCDDVADVLVVNVAGHIWREGGPQVLHLRETQRGRSAQRQSATTQTKRAAQTCKVLICILGISLNAFCFYFPRFQLRDSVEQHVLRRVVLGGFELTA